MQVVPFSVSPGGQIQRGPSGVSLHFELHRLAEQESTVHAGPSSVAFGQSALPLQTESSGIHRPVTPGHCQVCSGQTVLAGPQAWRESSSEPSPQSSWPSQIQDLKTHFELLHLKWLMGHSIWPQVEGSSDESSQSPVPSQYQDLGMQILDEEHWNDFSGSHWLGARDGQPFSSDES